MHSLIQSLFPFVRWFPLRPQTIRADLVAGITVALILVPQSMAYAQLAGLPVVYGLYASFVPVIVASLWGSSNKLHTGPVAMLSLMSAAALIPLATPGSATFIELSIMLAVMVGILRLVLGLFRLGAIVNMMSSPVIVGFTNAAALIIGLSQLSKVINVPFPRTDSYLADLWRVIEQLPQLHWPTLFFAIGTWVLIELMRKRTPRLPGVLVAVVVATIISGLIGFEKKTTVSIEQIQDEATAAQIKKYSAVQNRINELTNAITQRHVKADELEKLGDLEHFKKATALRSEATVLERELELLKSRNTVRSIDLHAHTLRAVKDKQGNTVFVAQGRTTDTSTADDDVWRFSGLNDEGIVLSAGGAVVGTIPKGLPSFNPPKIHWELIFTLLPAALVMALIGFMEATSISKAIAISSGERFDTNKELVGQGLANIAGSFFSSYTVSGSFSRSAVAARTGAQTGMFAIFSALAVVLVLLFFTDYLYHLPQAVLAVIVMMAVFGLIRVVPLIHAWKVDRPGAVIGIITFFATLIMAPAIANGILFGVGLTVLHCLIKTMRPRTEIVSRKVDGTLGGMRAHGLKPISQYFVPLRFDGSLIFVNVAYFEDMILKAHAEFPQARAILIIGSGINDIDASGVEKIFEVARSLRKAGVRLMFSSLKHQVMQAIEKSGLVEELGQDAFFSSKESAQRYLVEKYGTQDSESGISRDEENSPSPKAS